MTLDYCRSEEIQECLDTNRWYGDFDAEEYGENLLYNPDDEAMETLAALKKEWFVYDAPFLLSQDRKILYGFVAENRKWLEIPKTVEVYDNLFIHEEDFGYENISIPKSLMLIESLQNPFGFFVMNYKVSEGNELFSSKDGILYDLEQEKLILFPSGRNRDKKGYCQLPFELEEIGPYAFYMRDFLKALVIPPNVNLCNQAFFVHCDEGKIFVHEEWEPYFEKLFRHGNIHGIEVKYYESVL